MYQGSQHTNNFVESKINLKSNFKFILDSTKLKFDMTAHFSFYLVYVLGWGEWG